MNPYTLPVYQQKHKILKFLETNQVIIVESPTGSGKTTQIPIILHEAGYSKTGTIGVTQPRRIAALSVCEFISKQLNSSTSQLNNSTSDIVGYKMRFEDTTHFSTKIKIMTDGILLQEMKLDPWLSKYSTIMIDEAHERSLNIDFILGLLKRIIKERTDLKIIISSATINTQLFSTYFNNAPIIKIDAITYPVSIIYDPPKISLLPHQNITDDIIIDKIVSVIDRIISENYAGDILVFLPGERIIKNCIQKIYTRDWAHKAFILPLYGRLSKEEQERVFDKTPAKKTKIVVSTNIAETSVTIDGITTVIDSGLAKLNFYNPHTFTSSLIEIPVSKASCNQRKGRAGRTQEGTCYRLFEREDFKSRPLYTTEEIFRTDLSEVLLRMAEIGIFDFENFDFISKPSEEGIDSAIETLELLDALEKDRSLSRIGKLMCAFPLLPRQSRIIVEALLFYPQVIDEVIIATSFLSAQSPFILPVGQEIEARKAHHNFSDPLGDFVSYLKLYKNYKVAKNKIKFCEFNFLDERVMIEIVNIKEQLEIIVSDLGFPLTSGGSFLDYLSCIATGLVQFICVYNGKNTYKSQTEEQIRIHPGSNLYKETPRFIVAGEIVKTSRMYAMSVSPLTQEIVSKINKKFAMTHTKKRQSKKESIILQKNIKPKKDLDTVSFGNETFKLKKIKGKKEILLPLDSFLKALNNIDLSGSFIKNLNGLRGRVLIDKYEVLAGEKFELIVKIIFTFGLKPIDTDTWPKNKTFNYIESPHQLLDNIHFLFRLSIAKQKSKQLGFICLFTDRNGQYWFKISRGIHTALHETLVSLESLIEETDNLVHPVNFSQLNSLYRKVNSFFN